MAITRFHLRHTPAESPDQPDTYRVALNLAKQLDQVLGGDLFESLSQEEDPDPNIAARPIRRRRVSNPPLEAIQECIKRECCSSNGIPDVLDSADDDR